VGTPLKITVHSRHFAQGAIFILLISNVVACGDKNIVESVSQPRVYTGVEHSETIPHMDILGKLEKADAKRDLHAALDKKDMRFVGYIGYSLNVPPIQSVDYEIIHGAKSGGNKYGVRINKKIYEVRIIEGISDNFLNEEHARLIQVGVKYITEYNRLMLEYLKEQESKLRKAH